MSTIHITSTPIMILPTTLVRLTRREVLDLMEDLAEQDPNPFAGNSTLDHTADESFWLDFTAIAQQEPAIARTLGYCLKVEGRRLTRGDELVMEVLEFFDGTIWHAQKYAVIAAMASLVYTVLRRYRTPLAIQYQLPQMSYEQVPVVPTNCATRLLKS